MTQDRADFLDEFLSLITDSAIRYCVIDGHAVNAYAEPLVSLDLDAPLPPKISIALKRFSPAGFISSDFRTV